ncbi:MULTISPECIES: hypothetical protein [Methylotenera]|uniref:hypothetical protein n=1 Tax=Methylotenera TaxID=359407 RepID=UPI00035F432E|nr:MULTISPECIES: hypothetical protein [Methylotenera]
MRVIVLLMLSYLVLPLVQISHAAEPMGRLFSSPAERSTLNYLRQTKKPNIAIQPETSVQQAEPEVRALPDAINMQGYVKRTDGKQGTVWINDQAMQENSGNQDVQVGRLPEHGNRIPIKLPANGKHLTLKAGQVYDPENNRVREARSHAAQGDSGTIDGTIGDTEY